MLEEYAEVLGARFLECAFASSVDFIITVNTAPGHFDRKNFQTVGVVTPGEFLNLAEVSRLVARLNAKSRHHEITK